MCPAHINLRRGRHPLACHAYLITFCTHGRLPLFEDHELARAASAAIIDSRLWNDATLLAWVLMPDHFHGIVQAGEEPLARSVQRLKCNAARQVNQLRLRSGSIWAPAFHDRGLANDDAVLCAARYLVMNPTRAGLVTRPGDYPYWDAVWL